MKLAVASHVIAAVYAARQRGTAIYPFLPLEKANFKLNVRWGGSRHACRRCQYAAVQQAGGWKANVMPMQYAEQIDAFEGGSAQRAERRGRVQSKADDHGEQS